MFESLTALDYKVYCFVVGLFIAACCSLLSTYIVLRRMALISEGVSHAGFGGIGIALTLGTVIASANSEVGQRLITGVFCLGTALAIGYFTRSRKVHEDSAIGIFLVASVALGELLIQARTKFFPANGVTIPSVESLLFGDFIAVSWVDAVLAVATAAVCFGAVVMLFHEFLYTTLDEEMARVNGVPTRAVNTLQLVLISLVIVIGVRMVGFLMITAMTIIPGATGAMLSRRFGGVMLASLAVGVGSTAVALTLSFTTVLNKFKPGPILVITLFVVFCAVWLYRHFARPRVAHAHLPETASHGHVH